MPGKQKREKALPLSRLQSKIAGQVLRPHFDPKKGEKQFDEEAKMNLVRACNDAFVVAGEDPVYTQRKLEDWVSNGIYRWRKQASNKLPPSWAQRLSAARQAGAVNESPGGDAHKRKRALSSGTLKPLGKVVKGRSAEEGQDSQAPWRQQQPQQPQQQCVAPTMTPAASGVVQSPEYLSLDAVLTSAAQGFAVQHDVPASAAPNQESMASGIRRRTLSERSLRLQAQAALNAEAE